MTIHNDQALLRFIARKVNMLNDWHLEINAWRKAVDWKLRLVLLGSFGGFAGGVIQIVKFLREIGVLP